MDCHKSLLESGASAASLEDALHTLDREGTPVALTQPSWADYDAVNGWLSQQLLSAYPLGVLC